MKENNHGIHGVVTFIMAQKQNKGKIKFPSEKHVNLLLHKIRAAVAVISSIQNAFCLFKWANVCTKFPEFRALTLSTIKLVHSNKQEDDCSIGNFIPRQADLRILVRCQKFAFCVISSSSHDRTIFHAFSRPSTLRNFCSNILSSFLLHPQKLYKDENLFHYASSFFYLFCIVIMRL